MKTLAIALSSSLLVFVLPGPVEAAKLKVPTANPNIQAAVGAAIPGDVAEVAQGTYEKNVLVGVRVQVMIRARGSDKVVMKSAGGPSCMRLYQCAGVDVVDLRFEGAPTGVSTPTGASSAAAGSRTPREMESASPASSTPSRGIVSRSAAAVSR